MPDARIARGDDLAALLALFRVSEVSAAPEPVEQVERIWAKMLSRDGLTVFVSEAESKIVSTCMLITAPNLLRSGRQHAFLENVVTHPGFRGRGFGRAVVLAALAAAATVVAAGALPLRLNLALAAVVGIAAGLLSERREAR